MDRQKLEPALKALEDEGFEVFKIDINESIQPKSYVARRDVVSITILLHPRSTDPEFDIGGTNE